mmetsp:Transcript_14579/g.28197  ORF Transcript_14579/g.28197 Transcript_14579/m.28197 type:complete len:216 (-) Transcript_14579:225-872(-)
MRVRLHHQALYIRAPVLQHRVRFSDHLLVVLLHFRDPRVPDVSLGAKLRLPKHRVEVLLRRFQESVSMKVSPGFEQLRQRSQARGEAVQPLLLLDRRLVLRLDAQESVQVASRLLHLAHGSVKLRPLQQGLLGFPVQLQCSVQVGQGLVRLPRSSVCKRPLEETHFLLRVTLDHLGVRRDGLGVLLPPKKRVTELKHVTQTASICWGGVTDHRDE